MSVRKFVWRWSWRQVRNEWRQYIVIVTMLTLGVTAAIAGVLTAHNVAAPPTSDFGNGQIAVQTNDLGVVSDALSRNNIAFGAIHDSNFERPGQVGQVALRAADPTNRITEPLVDLIEGRWPDAADEVAITDRALADRLSIGDSLIIGDSSVEIVGVVENPASLSDEFVFTSEEHGLQLVDDFDTRLLVDASADEVTAAVGGQARLGIAETGGLSDRSAVTLIVNVITAFGMLEIGLLTGSAFAVIARRRTRQYGLLASAGATPRMIRRTATGIGVIIGLIGAALGFVTGSGIAAVLVPAMEGAVDHRISFEFPLVSLIPCVLMAIAISTITARRPTNALTKESVATLLSSVRPKPEPVGKSSIVGVVLAAVGIVLLVQGFIRLNDAMAISGTFLTPIGLLLFAPLLVKLLGVVAARLPLSERLGGRTLSRYNRRSASLVAALALALAVPVAIAVVSSSIDARAADEPPNLTDDQLILWAPDIELWRSMIPESTDEVELDQAQQAISEIDADLTFVPLQVVIPRPDDVFSENGDRWFSPLVSGELAADECSFCDENRIGFEEGIYLAKLAFVATPELLAVFDLDDQWIAEGKQALAGRDGLTLLTREGPLDDDAVSVSSTWPNIGSFPELLYSPDYVGEDGPTTVGWIAVGEEPLSDDLLSTIAEANLGNTALELPNPPEPRSTLRLAGLAIGAFVGLLITAAGVVLLNAEIARESAVLASLGSRPRTGRRMSASISGLLAVCGAGLGVAIGFIPLVPMMSLKVDPFPFVVPWSVLLGLGVAFPICAAVLGSLLSKSTAAGRNLRDYI